MDIFKLVRNLTKKAKLFTLYWRRIIFVKNNFKVSFFTKLKANLFGGYLADQWALYGLTFKNKGEYLSEFDWYRSRYINEPFDYMLNNKIVSTEVFKQYIRVPEIFAVKKDKYLMDFAGNNLSDKGLLEMIKAHGSVFIKPYGKGKGNGVNRVCHIEGRFFLDDMEISSGELCQNVMKREEFYISEEVKQHDYADLLYDKTVNTIRIITLRDPKTDKFKVFFAVQRIGTEATIPVDNASKGGLVCKIDLETGRLTQGRSLHNLTVYESHPDSGTRFEDVVIPDWQEMKEEILELARRFPYLHFIAWDIIKLKDGTNCVIEANTSSGVNIIQLWGGQRKGELGDFYRAHKVI